MSTPIIVLSSGPIVSFFIGKGNTEVHHVNHYITLSVYHTFGENRIIGVTHPSFP